MLRWRKAASNIRIYQFFFRGDESLKCFIVAKILVLQFGALGLRQLTQEILDESRVALGTVWHGL